MMAHDESAMTDLLAALRTGGGLDIVRAARGIVLPLVGAAPPHRPGRAGSGDAGLCAWHLHP